MSTRGCIGVYTNDEHIWKAKYHHFDAYPTGLGRDLYSKLQFEFEWDLKVMMDIILAETVGWSTIVGKHLKKTSAFREIGEYDEEDDRPLSYSARGETPQTPEGDWVYGNDKDSSQLEWAYIFNLDKMTMDVKKYHYPSRSWLDVVSINLLEPVEIDWELIEKQGYKE